jgi:EmrB/QacA subfamily drug resistance transporter
MFTDRKWLTLAAVTFASFATTLDNTVVNVALPSIQHDLHLGRSGLEWVVNSYVLAFGMLLLAGGRLADVFGRRRMFLIGLGVFTGASVAGGLADGQTLLVAARVAQGVGAAVMTPTALAIIAATFPESERGKAIGIWAAATTVAFALGPVTGGFLAERIHWSWIFFVNVPIGLAGLGVGRLVIDGSGETPQRRRIDLGGLITSSLAALTLIYALIAANRDGWTSPTIVGFVAVGAVALSAFVLIEMRGDMPMLPLGLFRNREFAGANTVMWLVGIGVFGVYFFMSLYLQDILHLSAIEAGAGFVPMALVIVALAPASTSLADRLGRGRVIAAGMATFAAGLALLAQTGSTATYTDVLPGLLVAGVGAALTTPLSAAVLAAVPVERGGVASGVLNTLREIGGSFGIALMGALLTAREMHSLASGAGHADAYVSGFSAALWASAAAMLFGAVIAWLTISSRTSAVRPARPALEAA